jgi:serine phosphatase RsbU (regulator of sigma subunit)
MVCHALALRAAMENVKKDPKRALGTLNQAEALARDENSYWGLYEVARIRAYAYQAVGNQEAALRSVGQAVRIAGEQGWVVRAGVLERDFDLDQSGTTMTTVTLGSGRRRTHSSSSAGTASAPILQRHQRKLDALLQVSLASAKVLDPDQQASVALDQVVSILGAERAVFFLADDKGGSFVIKAARDARGESITELKGFSNTVVQQVKSSRKALVVSGTEQGELLGSKSIVAHDLRSIMAAPMILHDKLVGVIYLDNRVTKGVFTEDDVEILTAVGNHIAIAIETARAAKSELQRQALEKDLAVTGEVQALFLPKLAEFDVPGARIAAHYQPAAVCGGDWWWRSRRPDGKEVIIIGDVTGHGPGPAMVTAALASGFKFIDESPAPAIPEVLRRINKLIWEICKGSYLVSLLTIELDPSTGELKTWSAGGLPPYLLSEARGLEAVVAPPAGLIGFSEQIEMECHVRTLSKGDLLLLYTDGLTEMKIPDGKMLGKREARKILTGLKGMAATQARERMVKELGETRKDTPLDDDLTFVLIEKT